jgi:two-component system cell cycle sensor histidine kinase/response regulator CckA
MDEKNSRDNIPPADSIPEAGDGASAGDVILLAEDDDGIRRLVRIVLEGKGYVVLDACNGVEGLALCKTHVGQIDLLLSDVIMPVLGGRELADGALRMRPGLKILFMSGFSEDTVVEDGIARGNGFLQKPFTSQALSQKVRATIDAPQARTALA